MNNYGATETSIPTIGTYGKHVYADTCGKPYPDIKVKIDRSGELLIKSPYMMIGYYGDKSPQMKLSILTAGSSQETLQGSISIKISSFSADVKKISSYPQAKSRP